MSVFLTSVSSVVEIVLIMALGYILRRNNWFADSFGGNIASLITKIALPASIFMSVMKYLTKDKLLGFRDWDYFPSIGSDCQLPSGFCSCEVVQDSTRSPRDLY